MTGKHRGDDPGYTGCLFDRLRDEFEPQQLFLDVHSIAPGLDFLRVVGERVAECDVLPAVIGKNWIDARTGRATVGSTIPAILSASRSYRH